MIDLCIVYRLDQNLDDTRVHRCRRIVICLGNASNVDCIETYWNYIVLLF
jgi:hypothetical protein